MTKMSCKISVLEEICRLASLKGKNPQGKEYVAIPDLLLQVFNRISGSMPGKSAVIVKAIDNKGAIGVALINYNVNVLEPGVIPIGDVEKFVKYLSRFNSSDEVTVETTENRIILERKEPYKKATIPMASVDSISSNKNAEQILSNFQKTETGFFKSKKTNLNIRLTLNADDIKSVIDDGEVVGQRIYPWQLEENRLVIKVGEERLGEIETVIPTTKVETETPPANTKTSFAYGVDNIFGNLSGEIQVYLANNAEVCPLILTKETDTYKLKILLAPVMVE